MYKGGRKGSYDDVIFAVVYFFFGKVIQALPSQ